MIFAFKQTAIIIKFILTMYAGFKI